MEEVEIKIRHKKGILPKMEILCKQQCWRLEGLLGGESWESVGDPGAGFLDIVIGTMPCGGEN